MLNNLKERFNEFWGQIDDNQKPKLIGLSIIGVALLLVMFAASEIQDESDKKEAEKAPKTPSVTIEKKLLSSNEYADLSKDMMNLEIKRLKEKLEDEKKGQDSKAKLLERKIDVQTQASQKIQDELRDVTKQLDRVAKTAVVKQDDGEKLVADQISPGLRGELEEIISMQMRNQEAKLKKMLEEQEKKQKIFAKEETLEFAKPSVKSGDEVVQIKSFTVNDNSIDKKPLGEQASASEDSAEQSALPDVAEKDKNLGTYLPVGSILKGVILSGVDAPTYVGAKEDPRPLLVTLKMDAILPNGYQSDIRECFLSSSGFGSLAEERVNIRSEYLSCIRNDGGVIEVPMEAYAVSEEDGKAGVRGRLVSREGAMIARSMTASFIDGVATAFAPASSIAPTALSSSPFETPDGASVARSGALSGAASAMKQMAAYYQKMATQLYPVLEVDAGREITFILTKGVDLKIS